MITDHSNIMVDPWIDQAIMDQAMQRGHGRVVGFNIKPSFVDAHADYGAGQEGRGERLDARDRG